MSELWHDAFYRFVEVDRLDATVTAVREICEDLDLLGSILLASEGVNGMLAGTASQLDGFRESLSADLRFAPMTYRRSPCKTQPFRRLKVRRRREIVPLGIAGVDATKGSATSLDPAAWRELLQQDDVVLIDNRNDFEVRLGRFKDAVNPEVKNFRDFPGYVEANLAAWQDKKVAMYCTGGIRCEKAGAWMLDLGLEVYQLGGGILNYFQSMPDAERDFEGECFVFDNRIALDTRLRETATSLADIYDESPDEQWRLERAKLLQAPE